MKTLCKLCNATADIGSGYCRVHEPDHQAITITVYVREDGYFCNAVHGANFVCTTIQPTLDMSLASAMSWVRNEVAAIRPE